MLFTTRMNKKWGLAILGCVIAILGCVFIGADSVDAELKISDMTMGDLFIWIMGPTCFGIGGILAIMGLFIDKNYIDFYEEHIEGVASVKKQFSLKYDEIEKYSYKVANFAGLGVITITSNGMDYLITIDHSAYSTVKKHLDGKKES